MAPEKKPEAVIPQIGVKNVPESVAEKLQAIANNEGVSFNEIYNLAFVKLIEAYEKKYGKVKPQEKGARLKNL